MDDMNNRQMVLLTMLTSFVVSVGTGILTVAMLEEAPPTLTQTVNHVVERTIERVVAGTSTQEKVTQPVSTITKEVTIFAKEDDLVVAAVEKNKPRVALIFSGAQATDTPALAVGFVVSRDGVVITDKKSISSTETGLRESYRVVVGATTYTGVPIKYSGAKDTPLVLLKLSGTQPKEGFDAATFGRQVDPKSAQSVVAIGDAGDVSGIYKGTLTRMHYTKDTGTSTASTLISIDASPTIPAATAGALVVNLDGQAIGIVVNDAGGGLVVSPASRILDLVATISADASGGATTPASKSGNSSPVPQSATTR
jgi:hypothetical protein